jgi:SAM-dependent methyltransferase
MSEYDEKLRREKEWYEPGGFQANHFLNSRFFHSPERVALSVGFCKTQFAKRIREVLADDHLANPLMLVAPTGSGNDLPYLLPLSRRIVGVDISQAAMDAIPDGRLEKHVGDIKNMAMFPDGQFDLVIMSNFFHHFLGFGFDEFLKEARRVLRPRGHFFAFEPNILHPFSMAAWVGKKVFGNITGCVEDESPFRPGRLITALKRCRFEAVAFSAANYAHHRMPVPLTRLVLATTGPLLRAPVIKHFGSDCIFYGRKP